MDIQFNKIEVTLDEIKIATRPNVYRLFWYDEEPTKLLKQ
jgi:hypothetical protein